MVDRHVTLGSRSTVEVVIDDPGVAELHLAIEPRAEGVWLRDLGSSGAAAYIGGQRVSECVVPGGTTVSIANIAIEVRHRRSISARSLWPTSAV